MLEREFQYYLDHQKELVKKYKGMFLVIVQDQVVGVFHTKQQAYNDGTSKYQLGKFLIQECLPGSEGHSQTFHSRVIIKGA